MALTKCDQVGNAALFSPFRLSSTLPSDSPLPSLQTLLYPPVSRMRPVLVMKSHVRQSTIPSTPDMYIKPSLRENLGAVSLMIFCKNKQDRIQRLMRVCMWRGRPYRLVLAWQATPSKGGSKGSGVMPPRKIVQLILEIVYSSA